MTTNVNIILSQRSAGIIVLPLTRATYDLAVDATVGASAATPSIVASSNAQIWEIVPDVDIRVLFTGTVTGSTGRKLKAGIPYTFAAVAGETPSMMLA
jgi:hypothetical protein